ncbi:MAG: hypothetical protein QM765_36840 [Myxococcales bacterium]
MLADPRLNNAIKLQGAVDGVDATSLHFVGQGLGAMLGSLYVAANPAVQRVVLNAPGTDVLDLILESPALASIKTLRLSKLHAAEVDAGTPAFEQYLGFHRARRPAGRVHPGAVRGRGHPRLAGPARAQVRGRPLGLAGAGDAAPLGRAVRRPSGGSRRPGDLSRRAAGWLRIHGSRRPLGRLRAR